MYDSLSFCFDCWRVLHSVKTSSSESQPKQESQDKFRKVGLGFPLSGISSHM